MTRTLEGRVAVITGASRGIGLGIARRFREAGARLHLVADDAAVKDRAGELGGTAAVADISDPKQVEEAVEGLDRIDILVNNAGLELMTPLTDATEEGIEALRRIVSINVIGTALVTRRVLPLMPQGAAIVNTASIWGRVAEPAFDAYVASKHAVIGLTKTWARELGPRGIRVNAVCPGWVRTEASLRSLRRMAATAGRTEGDLLSDIMSGQALPGLMEPADIADAYLFLASDAARNVTGQSLGVDRGEVPW